MNFIYSSMILFNWLFLTGVIFLAGAYASRVYVTGPSGAEVCFTDSRNKYFKETVTKYLFFISVLTLLANTIHFVLHCAVMTETPLQEVFSILPLFLTKTKYGTFTILRSVFLAAIIAVSFVGMMKDQKRTTLAGLVFSLLLLVVIAMSGHQGVEGYMNFAFFLDALHLVAVSLWIGGIIFIRFFLAAFVKGAYTEFWQNLTTLVNRFSQLATYCVFIAAVTGALLSYVIVEGFPGVTKTQYDIVLLVKIFLVGVIAIIGGMNKFSVIPEMNAVKAENRAEGLARGSRLLHLVTIEAGLGSVIVLLTSILRHLSPEG